MKDKITETNAQDTNKPYGFHDSMGDGWYWFATLEEAQKECENNLQEYRDNASEGWIETPHDLAIVKLVQPIVEIIEELSKEESEDLQELVGEKFDHTLDFKLSDNLVGAVV